MATIDCREQRNSLRDRHIEDIGDRLASQGDLQRLGRVAASLALGAAEVEVAEKLHLNLFKATPPTALAPARTGVEAEVAHRQSLRLRFRRVREKLPHEIKGAEIDNRRRPRCAA